MMSRRSGSASSSQNQTPSARPSHELFTSNFTDISVPHPQSNVSDPGPGGVPSASPSSNMAPSHPHHPTLPHHQQHPHTAAIHLVERPGSTIHGHRLPPTPPLRAPSPPVQAGWDFEFVPKPDSKYECPICLLVLRDVFQTMCGHRFCSVCIHKWLRTPPDVHCPVCNEVITDSQLFPDKFANREILSFPIRCPHYRSGDQFGTTGCVVILALKDLEEHLATVCLYEIVECPNRCRTQLLRKDVPNHCEKECLYRMVHCKHCKQRVPITDETVHYKECPEMTTNCEYCNKPFLRKFIAQHKSEECDEAPAYCRFYKVGCIKQLTRKTLQEHNKNTIQTHIDLLMDMMNQLMTQLPQVSTSASPGTTSGHVTTTSQVAQGARRQSSQFSRNQPNEGSFRGTSNSMKQGYSHLKPHVSPNTGSWEEVNAPSTRPFGSESIGLGLTCAEAAGDGESLKPSLFDDLDEKRRHQDGRLVQHDQQLLALTAKIENMEKKIREQSAIVQEKDEQINSLEARLCNGTYYWRIEDFSAQRTEARNGLVTVLHSAGFYTSSHGFKLCIRANLNGVDGGSGSHISLFIHFMRGKFDDVLDWPFKGRITLSILDQGEPKQHITEVLESKPNLAAFQKPHSNRNHKGFGYIEFAPIGLIENSSYVKNDTLIIKAEVEEIK